MTSTEEASSQKIDVMIIDKILAAARARATREARDMSLIARAVIIRASKAAQPSEDGVAHPAQRPALANRKRIRFLMDREAYSIAKSRIRASGQSVTAVLEEGLENYARTGKF
jgi:hypothetical protein